MFYLIFVDRKKHTKKHFHLHYSVSPDDAPHGEKVQEIMPKMKQFMNLVEVPVKQQEVWNGLTQITSDVQFCNNLSVFSEVF